MLGLEFTSIFWLRDEVYDQAERDDVPTGSIGRFVEKEKVLLLDRGVSGMEINKFHLNPWDSLVVVWFQSADLQ